MRKMREKYFAAILALSLVSVLALSGCTYTPDPVPDDKIEFKETQKFESYDALVSAFQEQGGYARGFDILESVTAVGVIAESSIASDGAAKSTPDFSTTNVQVEGVDEADIVKSDGRYIYNFSQNKLIITDAYPIETAKIVTNLELTDVSPIEMFVEGDKLLLFGTKSREAYGIIQEKIAAPSSETTATSASPTIVGDGFYPYYYQPTVTVQLYDISDRSNPKLEKEIGFEGNYKTSRLIGDQAYFVINTWPRYDFYRGGIGPIPLISDAIDAIEGEVTKVIEEVTGEERKESTETKEETDIIPVIIENGVAKRIAEPEEISYIPPMPIQSFVTIGSINLETGKLEKEVLAGNADNVFASEKNIYLSSTAWLPPDTPIINEAERFVYGDTQTTVINKFGLKKGEVGFLGQGKVPGTVLNQFSMDEHKGNFRIATTRNSFNFERNEQTNNLYVLDKDMETIGTLEDLAPGERIFSVRFMGDRAYMVTFKKVDPLFVIDVSDPENPKVLGKLKIPGFSDYLHPLDEDHIIGVGKDAVPSQKGDFAWYQGMKLAVFDVSDVENPIEKHKIIIGDRGTDSFALRNHKAFLFDKEKELLVLPIQLHEISDEKKEIERPFDWPEYGEPVFQGAFVYRLTIEDGFEERGRITHISEEEELKRGYYYGFDYTVQRALYIGDVLYTLSDKMLKANDLETLDELKEFAFDE